MRKLYGALLACMLVSVFSYGQSESPDYTRRAAIGVYFFLNDYRTAANIRTSSLGTVLENKTFGKIKEMSPGLALTYMKGISNHLDYTITASGSFVDVAMQNRPPEGTEKFLLEVDAMVVGKMFSDKYWFTPTVNLGVGASKYSGYFGAYIPAGLGLQLNFFDEAYFIVNSQYRIPITETSNYHFYHSIGIAGTIGKKKDETSKLKRLPAIPLAVR
ncbi:MAG TPA: hypothetical protein VD996_02350 [Chitinophagaceae bacterium]|nr:hypothetical protein [Chitinophagaceae bacterium]